MLSDCPLQSPSQNPPKVLSRHPPSGCGTLACLRVFLGGCAGLELGTSCCAAESHRKCKRGSSSGSPHGATCRIVLCYTILYYIVLYYTILYYARLYHTIPHFLLPYYTLTCCPAGQASSCQRHCWKLTTLAARAETPTAKRPTWKAK